MDRLSSVMVRISLVWLLLGFAIGGAMLTDQHLPGDWRLWMTPSHGHMLFVGWFLQFVLGVAYWLMPRKRSPTRPLGYRSDLAWAAVGALNLGLALRVVGEVAERSGHASDLTYGILVGSAVLQFAAAVVFVGQLWGRLGPRPIRAGAGGERS